MMLRFLADENFNRHLLNELFRKAPRLDVEIAQNVGLGGCDDAAVLAWASERGRIVLTHDVNTMPGFAVERLSRNQRMPGVVVVFMRASLPSLVEDILLIADCDIAQVEGQIHFVPIH